LQLGSQKEKIHPNKKIDIPKPKIQPPINIKEMEVKKEERKKPSSLIPSLTENYHAFNQAIKQSEVEYNDYEETQMALALSLSLQDAPPQ